MKNIKWIFIAPVCVGLLFCGGKTEEPEETEMVAMQLTPKEQLGKFLFLDANLSTPQRGLQGRIISPTF